MLDQTLISRWYEVWLRQADQRFDSRHTDDFRRSWAWAMALIAEQHVSYYTDETEERQR